MLERLEVLRGDITQARMQQAPLPPLADGAVRLAVESFSLTANNVTYAAMGDGFGYWNFFSAPGDWGMVPVWGHARVTESRHPDLSVGERIYGYLPMASSLDVMPGHVNARGFVDQSEHRQPMSPIYNQYTRLNADPEHDPAREAERMIFGPLFKTGFLIEAFLRRNAWFGATTLIVTSASSKTALALASVVKHRSPHIRRIGLTSGGNVTFVERSGLYDAVLGYDQVEALPAEQAVSVDFAGNRDLLVRIHQAMGERLRHSSLVGVTHHDTAAQSAPDAMPGPAPQLFFAPDHAVAIVKEMGAEAFGQEVAESWHRFLTDLGQSVAVTRIDGLDAAQEAWSAMARGAIDPSTGVVVQIQVECPSPAPVQQ